MMAHSYFFQSRVSQWSTPSNVSETLVNYINYSDFEDGTVDMCRVSERSSVKDVIYHEFEPIGRRTVNSLCDVPDPEQIPIDSNNRCASECHSDIDLPSSLTLSNCITLLEMAKSNIMALIDDHIALFKDKSQSMQIQQHESIKELKLLEVRKTIERRHHIQQIREEITNKMNHFNKLLTELERI